MLAVNSKTTAVLNTKYKTLYSKHFVFTLSFVDRLINLQRTQDKNGMRVLVYLNIYSKYSRLKYTEPVITNKYV